MSRPTIFWTIERLHEDGSWKACLSAPRAIEIAATKPLDDTGLDAHPLFSLMPQNSDFYYAVSGWPFGRSKVLMRADLPEDASAYSRELLGGMGQYRQGHYSLRELRLFVRGLHPGVTCPQDCREAKPHLERLEFTLGRLDWISEVLVGPVEYDVGLPQHPSMARESNHARMQRLGYSARLLPITDETVRICLSHQN
jgi:hypothetical protein